MILDVAQRPIQILTVLMAITFSALASKLRSRIIPSGTTTPEIEEEAAQSEAAARASQLLACDNRTKPPPAAAAPATTNSVTESKRADQGTFFGVDCSLKSPKEGGSPEHEALAWNVTSPPLR